MRKALKIILQIIFLSLFVILVLIGKIQLWMAVFALGLVISLFFGRLYCGWACPINTLTGSLPRLKKRLGIENFRIPGFVKKPAMRYTVLGLFIALFVFSMITGKKLPVLPVLLVTGAVLSFFFPEELWHRFLCPYGTLFHIITRRPIYSMRINTSSCASCGLCKKVCPAAAIDKKDGYYKIKGDACLACFDCADKCCKNAITYKTAKT